MIDDLECGPIGLTLTIGIGTVGAIFFILLVFLFGQTYGQRCAKLHERNSPQWYQCIDELRNGKLE